MRTGAEELFHEQVVGLGDDEWELLGGKDVVEPGEDSLLGPVGNANTTGHVLDEVVLDVEI